MRKNLMSDFDSDWFLDYVVPATAFLRDIVLGLGVLALIVYMGWK